jgi:copper chaperone
MIELTLPSMTCGHCVRAVTQAVKAVDEQAEVQVDLQAHRVTIESSEPAERFRQALAEEGYEPA